MPEFNLCYSASTADEAGAFKLLELPPELAQVLDPLNPNAKPVTFTFKGQPNEDAVLCTDDKTYALRSIALSNSVLVVTAPSNGTTLDTDGGRDSVVIRDELHEVLELLPAVPKLHKLSGLLRGKEYDESDEVDDGAQRHARDYYSYQDARDEIQASDVELKRGLKEKRILIINDALRPISREYLHNLLQLVLNLLVSLSIPHENAPIDDLVSALADDHEVSRAVSTQLMSWFGEINDIENKWKMDINSVLKELGVGILRHYRHDPIERGVFMGKWKSVVGDTFEPSVDLGLLSGSYLVSASDDKEFLTFFPSSELPVDPAARFAELFLTKSRWKGNDIVFFLGEIAVNSKERDKLLLKYCRAITDAQGVWYTSRAQYGG